MKQSIAGQYGISEFNAIDVPAPDSGAETRHTHSAAVPSRDMRTAVIGLQATAGITIRR
jgi:hypothetical protein